MNKANSVLALPSMYIKDRSHKEFKIFFSASLRKNKNTGRKLSIETGK